MLFCLSSTSQFTPLGARELLINHAKLNDVRVVLSRRGGGGNPYIKKVGMLVENFEIDP